MSDEKPKHTPGPWTWSVNAKSHTVELSVGAYGNTVMNFVRWGMSGAQPQFNAGGFMKGASALAVPQSGREHHASWHKLIDHPDARLIASAPILLAELKRTQSRICSDICGEEHCDDCRSSSAAIAKAEGRE